MASRLRSRDFLLGSWVNLTDPAATEIVCDAGFDFVILDGEHAPFGIETTQSLIIAANGAGTPCIVRVGENSPMWLFQALDGGADGVLVPRSESVDDVRRAVASCQYPPAGNRGYGPRRASRYGKKEPGYRERANEEVAIVVQIETFGALDAVEEIVAVPGLTALFVGPNDLSGAFGLLGHTASQLVVDAITKVVEVAGGAGVPVGIASASTAEAVNARREQGFSFVAAGDDLDFLAAGANELVSSVHAGTRVP